MAKVRRIPTLPAISIQSYHLSIAQNWDSLGENPNAAQMDPRIIQTTPKHLTCLASIHFIPIDPLWGLLGVHGGANRTIMPPNSFSLGERRLSAPGAPRNIQTPPYTTYGRATLLA